MVGKPGVGVGTVIAGAWVGTTTFEVGWRVTFTAAAVGVAVFSAELSVFCKVGSAWVGAAPPALAMAVWVLLTISCRVWLVAAGVGRDGAAVCAGGCEAGRLQAVRIRVNARTRANNRVIFFM